MSSQMATWELNTNQLLIPDPKVAFGITLMRYVYMPVHYYVQFIFKPLASLLSVLR